MHKRLAPLFEQFETHAPKSDKPDDWHPGEIDLSRPFVLEHPENASPIHAATQQSALPQPPTATQER